MILTKEQMEDIWRNKPVGYLKIEKERLKKHKKYTCSVTPVYQNFGIRDEFVVFAISKYDAELKATEEYKKKYNIDTKDKTVTVAWTRYVRELK